jgi:hypothetical protein
MRVLTVGAGVGSEVAAGKLVWVGGGTGVGDNSGFNTVKANMLKLSTLAVAMDA